MRHSLEPAQTPAPATPSLGREDLYLPDRFEALRKAGGDSLRTIVHPVESTLGCLDARFAEMRMSDRGALMILRGESGAGKSTFLETAYLFRDGITTERVPNTTRVEAMLQALGACDGPRIVLIEGREALRAESTTALEADLHAINGFVRSDAGTNTLIVWPTNTDELAEVLSDLAATIGAEALFGVGAPIEIFVGPPRDRYVAIVERTIQALNRGASLAAMGISDEHAQVLVAQSRTIGHCIGLICDQLRKNGAHVKGLLKLEHYRLWTLVIAGNEPENDVAAVTRGSRSYADIDRLLSATSANVVSELKKYPERLGLLGSNLDARVVHMDMLTALAAARSHGDNALHKLMQIEGMSITHSGNKSAAERLLASELGLLLAADELGTRKPGSRPGGGTQSAFTSLTAIAKSNDGLINRAIGKGLLAAGLIESYEAEKDVGGALAFTSDLCLVRANEPIRLEIMWRSKTSRAEIANYVLGKLHNYGKTIGYLA
jgi:hypothetical protein